MTKKQKARSEVKNQFDYDDRIVMSVIRTLNKEEVLSTTADINIAMFFLDSVFNTSRSGQYMLYKGYTCDGEIEDKIGELLTRKKLNRRTSPTYSEWVVSTPNDYTTNILLRGLSISEEQISWVVDRVFKPYTPKQRHNRSAAYYVINNGENKKQRKVLEKSVNTEEPMTKLLEWAQNFKSNPLPVAHAI